MPGRYGPTTRVSDEQAQFYSELEQRAMGSADFRKAASKILNVGKMRPAGGSVDPAAAALGVAADLIVAGADGPLVPDITVDALCTLGLEMPWRGPFIGVAAGLWRAKGCEGPSAQVAQRIAAAVVEAQASAGPRSLAAAIRLLVCMSLPSVGVLNALDVATQLAEWAAAAAASPQHRLAGVLMEAVLEALMVGGDAVEAVRPGTPRECLDAAEAVATATRGGRCHEGSRIERASTASATLDRACVAARACVAMGWRAPSVHRPDLDPRVIEALAGGPTPSAWPPTGVSPEDLELVGPRIGGEDGGEDDDGARAASSSSGASGGRADAELPMVCCFHGLAEPLLAPGAGLASAAALAACGLGTAEGAVACDAPSAWLLQRAVVDCASTHYPLHEDAATEIARMAPTFPVGPLAVDAIVSVLLQRPRPALPSAYLQLLLKQLERADMRGLGCLSRVQHAAHGDKPDASPAGADGRGDGHGDDDEGEAAEAALVFAEPAPPNALRVSDGIATIARVAFRHADRLHPAALSRFADWCAAHSAASSWRWVWGDWAQRVAAPPAASPAQLALWSSATERAFGLQVASRADVLAEAISAEARTALTRAGRMPAAVHARAPADDVTPTPPPRTELDEAEQPRRGLGTAADAVAGTAAAGPGGPSLVSRVLEQVAGAQDPAKLTHAVSGRPDEQLAVAAAIVYHGRARPADVAMLARKYKDSLPTGAAGGAALAEAVASTWAESGIMAELVLLRLVSAGAVSPADALSRVVQPGRMLELWRRAAASSILQLALARLREARDAVMRFVHLFPGAGSHQEPSGDVRAEAGSASPDAPPIVGRSKGLPDLEAALAFASGQWDAAVDAVAVAVGSDTSAASRACGESIIQELLSLSGEGTFGTQPAPWADWFARGTAARVTAALGDAGSAGLAAECLAANSARGWGDTLPRLERDRLAPMPV